MLDFFLNQTYTFWIALYGGMLSTLVLVLNVKKMRRDQGKISLTGMIGRQALDSQGRGFVSSIIEKGKHCLSFNITNVGRRPLRACGLAAKEKFLGTSHLVIICKNLPKTLQESEDVIEVFYDFDFIKNEPWSIYVFDSLGKNHIMKRKHLKILYKNYKALQTQK